MKGRTYINLEGYSVLVGSPCTIRGPIGRAVLASRSLLMAITGDNIELVNAILGKPTKANMATIARFTCDRDDESPERVPFNKEGLQEDIPEEKPRATLANSAYRRDWGMAAEKLRAWYFDRHKGKALREAGEWSEDILAEENEISPEMARAMIRALRD